MSYLIAIGVASALAALIALYITLDQRSTVYLRTRSETVGLCHVQAVGIVGGVFAFVCACGAAVIQ